uniref:Uncharacterized protein n=1 Tax=Solanum tuberosum TaxID=4113 RepID=M1DE49_SOLTU
MGSLLIAERLRNGNLDHLKSQNPEDKWPTQTGDGLEQRADRRPFRQGPTCSAQCSPIGVSDLSNGLGHRRPSLKFCSGTFGMATPKVSCRDMPLQKRARRVVINEDAIVS